MPATIELRQEGAVAHLTLNRPELRNAMSMQMVVELRQALAQAEADGVTRVVVLRGAKGHFCAGADLKDLTTARMKLASHPQAIAEISAAFGELCAAFSQTGLALVAAVEGTVLGGGLGLMCAADVALAGESAAFWLPETGLGVVPAQIAPLLLERLGYGEAKRLAVTGARLDARQALELRLVHGVHPAEALEAAVQQTVDGILRCAPGAVAATKALLAKARFQMPSALVREAADLFQRAALGPEGKEGSMAFLQKRKAAWVPK